MEFVIVTDTMEADGETFEALYYGDELILESTFGPLGAEEVLEAVAMKNISVRVGRHILIDNRSEYAQEVLPMEGWPRYLSEIPEDVRD